MESNRNCAFVTRFRRIDIYIYIHNYILYTYIYTYIYAHTLYIYTVYLLRNGVQAQLRFRNKISQDRRRLVEQPLLLQLRRDSSLWRWVKQDWCFSSGRVRDLGLTRSSAPGLTHIDNWFVHKSLEIGPTLTLTLTRGKTRIDGALSSSHFFCNFEEIPVCTGTWKKNGVKWNVVRDGAHLNESVNTEVRNGSILAEQPLLLQFWRDSSL